MARERNYKASTYLSPKEVKMLRIAAAHSGESLSEYLRRAALTMAAIEERQRNIAASEEKEEP
jgi:hypothetical protein